MYVFFKELIAQSTGKIGKSSIDSGENKSSDSRRRRMNAPKMRFFRRYGRFCRSGILLDWRLLPPRQGKFGDPEQMQIKKQTSL